MDKQALMDYFFFDDADLFANRNGRLSDKQQKEMVQEDKTASKIVAVMGIVFFVVAMIYPLIDLIIPMIMAGRNSDFPFKPSRYLVPVIWVLIWGGLAAYCFYCDLTNKLNLKTVIVKQVVGPINIVGVETSSGGEHAHKYIEYDLHIKRVKFEVDEDLGGLMTQGDRYAVYYYNRNDGTGNHILSCEQFSKEPGGNSVPTIG